MSAQPLNHREVGKTRASARARARGVASLLALASAGSWSAGPGDRPGGGIEWQVTVEGLARTPAEDGTERFEIAAGPAAAGASELVYSVRFTNATPNAVDGVRITSAIPPTLRYIAGSAVGPGATPLFSVDGGLSFGAPDELVVVVNEQLRAAVPADYTHVRWLLTAPLEGEATGFVRFRAERR